ncbi:MAG: DUF4936 family protein [Betaproteobacteria bacterium]|nr:DUF4936 family protein [Betaproteobacteria bacterium]
MHVYIYYRVRTDDPETETLIRGLQARLACRACINGRLLKRCDDPLTWMEIYEDVADAQALLRQLDQLASEYDLMPFLDGERHVECFVSLRTPEHSLCRD